MSKRGKKSTVKNVQKGINYKSVGYRTVLALPQEEGDSGVISME